MIDAQQLLSDIIRADDGKQPAEKARHNMVDPFPIEVLDFCVAYMDETDAKILRLENIVRCLLECSNLPQLEKDYLEKALYNGE